MRMRMRMRYHEGPAPSSREGQGNTKFKCALLSSSHLNLRMGKPEKGWDASDSSEKVKGCHSIREGHRCHTEADKLPLVCSHVCACICCMGMCMCVCTLMCWLEEQ